LTRGDAVQNTLLGLAIAIILAIVAALVAPLVVDWNHYRASIEAEASRLTGLNVSVGGQIDASLLPSPTITLRNVEAGDPAHGPHLRVGTLKLELALGPLLRGRLQATQVQVIDPQLSLAVDASGAVAWPTPSPSSDLRTLSIAHLGVEHGTIMLTDAKSGSRLVLQNLRFSGEVDFAGAFNGSGAVVAGNEPYAFRLSGSRGGAGIDVRLGVDPSDRPLTSEFDGKLAFAHGVPQFDGTFAMAQLVGATLANGKRVVSAPWHATGNIRATPQKASLRKLIFRYGPEEREMDFGGSADFTFGSQPRLVGKISAMQVDVDRALAAPALTDRPPLALLRSFLQSFIAAATLPVPAQIGFRIDELRVGGTALDSVTGELGFDRSGWTLDHFQFHAPGSTQVSLSGRLTAAAHGFTFTGPAALSSADLAMLLAWLNGNGGKHPSGEAKTFSAQGIVTLASERMAVDRLTATLDQEKIDGHLAYTWPVNKQPAGLDAEIHAADLDVDALSAFARSAFGGNGPVLPRDATLVLDLGNATFAGTDAQNVKAQIKLDAGRLQIDHLSVGDIAGAKLDLSGRIDQLASQPQGQVTLDLDASALDGLRAIAVKLAPGRADTLRRLANLLAPAKVHAVFNVGQAAPSSTTAELRVSGSLAAMQVVIDAKASGEVSDLGAATLQVDSRLNSDDGTALIALLGLDRVLAVDQLPGQLTLTAAGRLDGDIHVDSKLETSGFASALAGIVRLIGDQKPWAKLHLQTAAGDLRPLHQVMVGQVGAAVPVSAQADVLVDGAKLSFSNIAGSVGKSSLHGHVAIDWASPVTIAGAIEADDVNAPALMATALGLPGKTAGNGSIWSTKPIGSGAFAVNGALSFKFDRAQLTPALVAEQLTGVAHFSPAAIDVDNIEAGIAGGHLGGTLQFRRNADGLGADAKLDFADIDASSLGGSSMKLSGGRLTLMLSSDGFGATPAALIGSLHGKASVTANGVQFAGIDTAAFRAARQAAGRSEPIDMNRVRNAVKAALANGQLTIAKGKADLAIASGQIDFNQVALQSDNGARLSLDGAIDLGNAAINTRLTLSEAPPVSALISVRPELSIEVKGPVAAPQRTLDMSALASWLTLSAAELQTRRIESIEASQREGTAGAAGHVRLPDFHLPASGTVVESAMPQNLRSAPIPGTGDLERLVQPVTPPAAPPAAPQQNHPASAAHNNGTSPAIAAPVASGPRQVSGSSAGNKPTTSGVIQRLLRSMPAAGAPVIPGD
jgi:uncharacterized protein involved in outer membrane biogenesis